MLFGSGDPSALDLTADDVKRQGDRNLIPRFFRETRGKPDGSFEDIEMIEILVPGDSKSGPVLLVDDRVKRRFPDAYRNWKAGLAESIQGTPLQLLTGEGSELYRFKAMNIHTVEAMAALNDGQIEALGMGGRALRDRAKRIIADRDTIREQQDKDDKDRRIATLERQIQEMLARQNKPSDAAAIEAAVRASDQPPVSGIPEGAAAVTSDRPRPRLPKAEGVRQ